MRILGHHSDRAASGFSLLELIGVLAVMAVLAAMILPFLTLSIDKAVYDRETADLAAFDSALQRSVMRLGAISNAVTLPEQIATELGVQSASVAVNHRGQPRYFLIDPALEIGTSGGGLPYIQTDAGSQIAPANPRVMIVTSLGERLTGLASGTPSVASDFDVLWNTPVGSVPAISAFAGWRGKSADLRIRRIDLSPLFVRLELSRRQSAAGPSYSVTGAAYGSSVVLTTAPVAGYFLKSSTLLLYDQNGNLDSKQVLARDQSFVYSQNAWRGKLEADMTVDGMDLRSVVNQFIGAFPNPNASVSQTKVLQDIMAYFDAYRAWAEPPSSFANSGLKTAASTAQARMLQSIQDLYAVNPPTETVCLNP